MMEATGPRVSIIAAIAENGVIGHGNRLPWHLPADLAHFKRLTLDRTIVMGRRTWESLPGLLPRRRHIVVTRNAGYRAEGCVLVNSPEAAWLAAIGEPEIMLIGGAALYEAMMFMVQRMYLTLVSMRVEDGDAYFPQLDSSCWRETAREARPRDNRNPYDMNFVTLERVGSKQR